MTHKKSSHVGAIAAGLAGLTAAAVGTYYLYGSKEASKNRAKVKGWMLKAKGEVLEKLEDAQEVTESAYMQAVNAVMAKYHDMKTIDQAELEDFMKEMKDHWSGIRSTVEKATKEVKRSVTKPVAKKKGKK